MAKEQSSKKCFYRYHNGEHWSIKDLEWDEIDIDKNKNGCFCKACGERLSNGSLEKRATTDTSKRTLKRPLAQRENPVKSLSRRGNPKSSAKSFAENRLHNWKIIF